MKAAFFTGPDPSRLDYVYAGDTQARIGKMVKVHPTRITLGNFNEQLGAIQDVEIIFSTWGMPALSAAQILAMPRLKAVLYAAGSVKGFARPFLDKGIAVSSAASANAIPVAEFCTAQILLSCKRYFTNTRVARTRGWSDARPSAGNGVYNETVALIGAGAVARCLINLLKPYNLRIIVVDPYLSDAAATQLGIAQRVTLDQAFREAYVVSNHLPNLENLRHVFTEAHFASMRQGATFINTGRGAQVDEAALVKVFRAREDLTALLDVTHPEPPALDGALNQLPNVQISTHIAGSLNHEVVRMAEYMIEECRRLIEGVPLLYGVTLDMLDTMA